MSATLTGLSVGTHRLTATGPAGRPLRRVANEAHSPHRFVVRDGVVLTQFDMEVERNRN